MWAADVRASPEALHEPWFWTLVDLSFAVGAFPPLWFAYRHIRAIEAERAPAATPMPVVG